MNLLSLLERKFVANANPTQHSSIRATAMLAVPATIPVAIETPSV
jgi:hypothetical protein